MAAPIVLCDTKGMDRERWLECRMHGPDGSIPYTLGGSDISTIFGLNPWMTPLELWHIKQGSVEQSEPDNADQLEMGHLLEPICAHWYGKKTGNTVIEDTVLYQHPAISYALANIDYRFKENTGDSGVLECKSTTYRKSGDWADGAIPMYYELQGRWYMAVLDVELCDYAALWGNNPENDFVSPRIRRNQVTEEMIFERADAFIESLHRDIPPDMSEVSNPELALAALARVYGQSKAGLPTFEFSKKYERPLRRIAELQAQNAELNRQINENDREVSAHSVRIAEMMKEHERGILETTADKLLIDYITKYTRRPDSKKLKAQYPTVFEDVLKASPSRKVKVTVQAI
ncbi:MAG TPA: hypothetical protein DEB31_01035 [Clostridiales bacterium]|nr:hypothetical protein [Clostridiales bacterium]